MLPLGVFAIAIKILDTLHIKAKKWLFLQFLRLT